MGLIFALQYELDLPVEVKQGTIGRVALNIPWSGLYTESVIVTIEVSLLGAVAPGGVGSRCASARSRCLPARRYARPGSHCLTLCTMELHYKVVFKQL